MPGRILVAWSLTLVAATASLSAEPAAVTRTQDVIYGRKHGTALTLDVIRPKENGNGRGIIWVVSGGWYSSHDGINLGSCAAFTDRGYTVFAVVHGSQPKFTIPEVLEDMHRAVRYVRTHAAEYGVDPDRLGITGASAGGHLSLMQGTAGTPGKPASLDPVDRASSRVQAVACFFPPTDFLDYGKEGEDAVGRGILAAFAAPFEFRDFDNNQHKYVTVTDDEKIRATGRAISPVNHVSPDDPPTLIVHGDADKLVPFQQAELIIDKLGKAGVATKLVRKPGAAHGWPNIQADQQVMADWFDAHLLDKKPAQP